MKRSFVQSNNVMICRDQVFVSSAKHRHYEKMLKSSGKCFIYGKLVRNTNKVSLRFLLRDTLHEALFTGNLEGNIDNNS